MADGENLSLCRGRPAAELVERNKRFSAERVLPVIRLLIRQGKEIREGV
jgi:hypothetical protein